MRLINPRPNITWQGDSVKGYVAHREQWSGEKDAKALPAPLHVRVKPKLSDFLKLMELEDALAEYKRVKMTSPEDNGKLSAARDRYARAVAGFQTVRFGERVHEAMNV